MNRSVSRVLLLGVLAACSGGRRNASYRYTAMDTVTNQPVTVVSGPMPGGETFTGLFHSQEIGDVSLEQSGDTVIGCYEYDRAQCHVRGRIEGRVEGNLLRFSWTEDHRACGRLSVPPGRGYFLFWKDSANNGRASGEWGYSDNEDGNGQWLLFRVPNRRPRTCGSSGGQGPAEATDTSTSGSSASGSSSTGSSSTGSSSTGTSGTNSNDPLSGL
ncbi:MAG: hypothetical protein HY909_01400 [Deltaproteobacteria bacterium]|nr:hypothetical protein [Deltaproteobacteria bacterium]